MMDYPEPHKQSGRSAYYFYATVNGKRHHFSTGKKTKREAYSYIRNFYDKQVRNEYSMQTFKEYSSIYYVWETCPKIARAINEGIKTVLVPVFTQNEEITNLTTEIESFWEAFSRFTGSKKIKQSLCL